MTAALPHGVYVHVPWCRRRCPYCDFFFAVGTPDGRFVKALSEELQTRRHEVAAGPAASLYFGGGTPSMLDPHAIAQIIEILDKEIGFQDGAEMTLEANPEDLDEEKIRALAAAGIGRLSLGLQSFDDQALKFLGRVHDGEAAERVIEAAAACMRISVDLIGGLPDESDTRPLADCRRAIDAGAGQISLYLLTVEDGTKLDQWVQAGTVSMPDDDHAADTFSAISQALTSAGLVHVEVSSWSRPGQEPIHNRLYWGKGSYLGLGPGAHSMRFAGTEVVRRQSTASVSAWLDAPASATSDEETLVPIAAALEAAAFGLRDLLAGVKMDELFARHQVRFDVESALAPHLERGHVRREGMHFWITESGSLFADAVARDVLDAVAL